MPLRFSFISFALFAAFALCAQAPYTQKQYAWSVEKNLVYGVASNYLNQPDTLTLDLYKPLSPDTARPLLVLAHGGVWLSGCKEDMGWLCEEMAERGYVVATINYRKGWHKAGYIPNPINPGVFPGGNCLYPADSSEIIRAIYRGMQDLKGAVRWLKARVYSDSTCHHAVLAGGESAGGFVALAAAVLDRPAEKPAACNALPDAPPPGDNLSNCFTRNCVPQTAVVTPPMLKRPDLGPVDGDLNTNGFDADVLGVISFYGGVPAQALADHWLQGPDTPAFYFYHQTCDAVVPFGDGQPMGILSAYCNLGFTPWHYQMPRVYGNGAIAAYFAGLPDPPAAATDFLPCNAFDPNFALFECIRMNDNGSYHYIHNRPERAVKIAGFFSAPVAARLASPPCLVAANSPVRAAGLRVAPNPFHDRPRLYCDNPPRDPVLLTLTDSRGRLIWEERRVLAPGANALAWDRGLPEGLYFLRLAGRDGSMVWKVIFGK